MLGERSVKICSINDRPPCTNTLPSPQGEGTRGSGSLAPGEKGWRGLAPLHEEGCPDSRSRSTKQLLRPIEGAEFFKGGIDGSPTLYS